MATQTPTMMYCPRCKERGVKTPLVKLTPTSTEYRHGESPSITNIGGIQLIRCEREVGRRGSGVRCGYSEIIDQTIQ